MFFKFIQSISKYQNLIIILKLEKNSVWEFEINSKNGYVKERTHFFFQISVNDKIDSTMTADCERTFSEYNFIISYLGEVKSLEFKAQNKIETQKIIPSEFTKFINEQKILY